MGHSQLGTARTSNLLALAIIVLVLILVFSVLADALIPRQFSDNSFVAELCIGQRIVSGTIQAVWLQGFWLTAPPIPIVRVTPNTTEFNAPGTICGVIPWLSGTPGFWYKELRP